jgi:hypothetical protein
MLMGVLHALVGCTPVVLVAAASGFWLLLLRLLALSASRDASSSMQLCGCSPTLLATSACCSNERLLVVS